MDLFGKSELSSRSEGRQREHFRNSYFWDRMTHYVERLKAFSLSSKPPPALSYHRSNKAAIRFKYSSKRSKHSSGQRKNNGKRSLLHGHIIGQSCSSTPVISSRMPSFHSVIIKRWHQTQIITTHQSSTIQ